MTTPTSQGWLSAGSGTFNAPFTGYVAGTYTFTAEYNGDGIPLASCSTTLTG